ncbi:PQQ-binding-like beta-propeller repeat protein [Streptomyces sp. 130]|uniref:outer membrane protein assembly factor BamB family protein n=1 Tax=Streptomyces sp. 130 TaxID=2591006 RepID=UPI00117C6BD2|nr:PQQ-binding-like beta-propeller repeat protein [Streptomyces sp. 130]TRV76114.1 PQQ-binding-like beta-propeller repeat protein [Streptomyces sp. 130]
MEAPRQDEPRDFGPYTVLARLRETAAAVQYLARAEAPGGLVVVTAARPELAASPAFRHRFDAEARLAGRLAGDWVDEPLETRADGSDAPWTAAVYVPALTLAEAIEAAGPLPGRAVRVLGAGLAEALSRVHATGTVLHGLAPGTVLLAEDGPRLTAFGPLGAAAEASAGPGGRLSVRLGYLTPEQLAGEEAGPASDLFVLGLLLAYAATGTTPLADGPPAEAADRIAQAAPELAGVPDELRDLIARCLAKDPADRPTAGAVAAELAPEGAAALARDGWLPEGPAAAVAGQGVRAGQLAAAPESSAPLGNASAENPVPEQYPVSDEDPSGARGGHAPKSYGDVWDAVAPAPRPAPGPGIQDAVPPGHQPTPVPEWREPVAGGSTVPDASAALPDTRTTQLGVIGQPGPQAARPDRSGYGYPQPQPEPAPVPLPPAPVPDTAPPAEPRRSGPSRRGLLFGAVGGVAGLLVGGGTLYALTSGDEDEPGPDPKPAPTSARPSVAGLPPQPRWVYHHPANEPAPLTAAVWKDRLLVLSDESQVSAVDLRTGRRLWANPAGAGGRAALPVDDEHCFVARRDEFVWISTKDGKVAHRLACADGFKDAPGLEVGTLVGADATSIWFTAAHEVTVKAPKPKKGKKRGKDKQVVKSYLFAYDIAERKELWRSALPTGRGDIAPAYQLIAVREDSVVVRQRPASRTPAQVKAAKNKSRFTGYDRATGKPGWTTALGRVTPEAAAVGADDGMLYAAEGSGLRAFATPGGKARWTLKGGPASAFGVSVPKGDALYTTNRNHVVGAVDRASGKAVWQRSTEAAGDGTPVITLSSTGETLLAAEHSQVTAFSASDGKRLWKFQDIGDQGPDGETVKAGYQVLAYDRTAVVRRGRTVYAFPVD